MAERLTLVLEYQATYCCCYETNIRDLQFNMSSFTVALSFKCYPRSHPSVN